MIDDLCPYHEMKPSGLPWLGDVPKHWDMKRLRAVSTRITSGSRGWSRYMADNGPLFVRIGNLTRTGIDLRLVNTVRLLLPESVRGECYRTQLLPDDLLISITAWIGSVGVVPSDLGEAYVSQHVASCRLLASEVISRWAAYVIASPVGQAHGTMVMNGGTKQGLSLDDVKNYPLLLPPIDEQRLIVRFLDWHGAQTAKLIQAKQGILKLVAEEREALTQEVASSPKTQQMRLENVVDHIFRRVDRESLRNYTPVGLFNRGRGIFHKSPTRGDELGDSTFSWIEEGDLILSGQFAWEGAIALAGADEAGRIASHRYHILRGKEDLVQTIYLSSFLRTSFGNLLLNEHSRGAAGRNRPLNIRTLLKEKIPVPLQCEQARLVQLVTLEKRLAGSVAMFANRLREFRARLIADLVTGKLDVRAVAASLPEIAEWESTEQQLDDEDAELALDGAEAEELAA